MQQLLVGVLACPDMLEYIGTDKEAPGVSVTGLLYGDSRGHTSAAASKSPTGPAAAVRATDKHKSVSVRMAQHISPFSRKRRIGW